jgi:hypothetical protein
LRGISGEEKFGEALVSPLEVPEVLDPVFEGVGRHWPI